MPLKEGEDFNSILRCAARRKGDRRAAVRHRRSPSPLAARRSPFATRRSPLILPSVVRAASGKVSFFCVSF